MPPPRILIADDSALLRSALRGLFAAAGNYEIVEAEDGNDAITMAEQRQPDVMVLDFAMPAMDGLAVSREVQKRLPQIPVLMYTLHYTPQLLADAKAAGVKKLISKSDGVDLVAAVRDLLASNSGPNPEEPPKKTDAGQLIFQTPAVRTGS